MKNKRELSPKQCDELIKTLKGRFEKNMKRHKELDWSKVQTKLISPAVREKLWSLI